MLRKLIGDKKFYKMVLTIAVPVMIQNGITNIVSFLDTFMVGRIGSESMAGVSIANQLIFVYTLCLFGAVSGASIFGAQFFGQRDFEGMKHTLRFKILICLLLGLLATVTFTVFGDPLIRFYLNDQSSKGNLELTFANGHNYLFIMILGLFPFAFSMAYASTLREMGETRVPMIASLIAVATNVTLNYLLIFGKFCFPELGVVGAAIATVISRFIECLILLFHTHLHSDKYPFIKGIYRGFSIPVSLMKSIIKKGSPLLINEALWSSGMAILTQRYSTRGLEVVSALSVSTTVANIFNSLFLSLGSSTSFIIGPMLGAEENDKAKLSAYRMIFFSLCMSLCTSLILMGSCKYFPMLFNISSFERSLATKLIFTYACFTPLVSFVNVAYFTLRTGGKTVITFLFDSAYHWVVIVPCAFALSRFTDLPIIPLYAIVQSTEFFKCVIGFILIKKGVWINNIVNDLK